MAPYTVVVLAAALMMLARASTKGSMSMWSATEDTIVGYKSEGSACKYADKEMGGLNAPTARTPYIQSKNYCAVNRGMFGGGEICGTCFRLTFHGDHPQGLGRPGSKVVQVVDSGSWATFDCHMTAFHAITAADTHIFPITYEKVPCETSAEGPMAAVVHYDYYFTKFVFGNLRYPVKSAQLSIGGKNFDMQLIGGWWSAWTGPVDGTTSFTITEDSGDKVVLSNCFGGWTNRHTGDWCSQRHSSLLALQSEGLGNASAALAKPFVGSLRSASVQPLENATEEAKNTTAAEIFLP